MEVKSKMYSVAQIATKAGVSRIYVQKAIERGQLKATRVGKPWVIFENDYLTWNALRKSRNMQKDT